MTGKLRRMVVMALPANSLYTFTSGLFSQIGPSDVSDLAYLESLIRTDYERFHRGETLEDPKLRARFSKEDKGLLRDWMTVARARAATLQDASVLTALRIAAE
jgi:hypothetical protein